MTHSKEILTSRFCVVSRMLAGVFTVAFLSFTSFSQTPTPSPSPTEDADGRYTVASSVEVGGRFVDVSGNENKFRSDLNYKSGIRLFDSSVLIEDTGSGTKLFDSALIIASGWGADPGGVLRANIGRHGVYKLDTNFRRVAFFNNLNNHAIGGTRINYHNYNTTRNFGDVDLTIFPESQKFRLRLGASYNAQSGPFTFTSRASNVFGVDATARVEAYDFRVGADGRFLGFNLSGTYGYRDFTDRTTYRLPEATQGDVIDTRIILEMERENPINGRTHFGVFSVQRTFADRFDFTAKVMHSKTSMESRLSEFVRYIVGTAITRDEYTIVGDANRPQSRGDLGITWRVTDKFRLSNTFTFDTFRINGNLFLAQNQLSTNPTLSRYYNITKYKRFQNTIEGDYQFSDRLGVFVGYRFSTRDVTLSTFFRNVRTNAIDTGEEDAENTTHTLIAGTRFKPLKNWSIYADIEKGKADNVITRAGNSDFMNFRIRSIMRFNRVSANISYIDKQNEIPTDTVTAAIPRITDISSRTFSASIDWNPIDQLNVAGGYNYVHLTSRATVTFSGLPNVLSEYFVRDNYFFIDATVRPIRRVTFFGSYRWNKDLGHGDRPAPPVGVAQTNLLGGYPFDFKTPEVRVAVRLTRHLDWNLGYQYYNYKESPVQNISWGVPFQNYSAHLPYTSLRIYFGKGKDR